MMVVVTPNRLRTNTGGLGDNVITFVGDHFHCDDPSFSTDSQMVLQPLPDKSPKSQP